jgi:ribonucleoside-diphosphate reductase alpha chain
MSLQYGVPLEVYVNKFSHTRFEPWGYTKNPDIKIAKSLVDYIFRWLGITFLPGYGEMNKAVPVSPAEAGNSSLSPAGEIEAEIRPVATKVGGPNSGHGASKSPSPGLIGAAAPNGNGSSNGSHSSHGANGTHGTNGNGAAVAKKPAAASASAATTAATATATRLAVASDPQAAMVARHEQFASFQADAPSCDRCGAITARAGNCYLCYNCGNSMGCS